MLALATIPVTCWLCTFIATPRKQRFGDPSPDLDFDSETTKRQTGMPI